MEQALIKLLIVDDDDDIRQGLFAGIEWSELGFLAINQAVNGLDAIEKIEKEMPEVILTDIRMDKMDGLELIDYLSNNYPKIKIVLLSGYSDLDYYKRALEYKVFDFILKPTHIDDFRRVFTRLKKLIDEEKLQETSYQLLQKKVADSSIYIQQNDTIRLLEDKYKNTYELDEFLEKYNMQQLKSDVVMISAYFYYNQYLNEVSRLEVKKIKDELKELLKKAFEGEPSIILELPYEEIVAICKASDIKNLKMKIAQQIDKYNNSNITMFAGISNLCGDISQCSHFYKQAHVAMKQISYISGEKVVIYKELRTFPQAQRVKFHVSDILNSLYFKYDNDWEREINEIIDVFYGTVSYEYDYLDSICNNLYHEVAKHLESINPVIVESENFYTNISCILNLENKKKFIRDVFSIMSVLSMNCKTDGKSKVVARIDAIINEKYASSQLSLTYLSEMVGKSTAYISNLYKQETNMNINDVIIKKRIEYAKKLLLDTNLKTYKIAEEIGYADCSHFTKLFKKNVGISPSEYRNTIRK